MAKRAAPAAKSAPSAPAAITLDEILAENRDYSNQCTLHAFMATHLSASERDVIFKALADPTYQTTAIIKVLKRRGYGYSEQVLARHRRSGCKLCHMVVKT